MGSRAWYTPGLLHLLHLPASFRWSFARNGFSLPPLLLCLPFPLLSPGLFSLSVCLVLVPGRACKPFRPTVRLERESIDPLESVLALTKVSSSYLLSSEGLPSSSGRSCAALSGVVGAKAGGAYNRNVRVSRWQGTPRSSKRLFGKLLP